MIQRHIEGNLVFDAGVDALTSVQSSVKHMSERCECARYSVFF